MYIQNHWKFDPKRFCTPGNLPCIQARGQYLL